MIEISTKLIEQAVYELCYRANICINNYVYSKIFEAYSKTNDTKLKLILENAQVAYKNKMPLCQDTGQVIVFIEIGQNIFLTGEFINEAINNGVKKCYIDNFYRKSVVKDAVFDRTNTKTNTPCIIYSKYIERDEIKIKVLIKGAGSENKTKLEMMLPTSNREEIVKKCSQLIKEAGINACPPMFIGIGIGATAEKALLQSKEVLICNEFSNEECSLAQEIKEEVNKNSEYFYVLDVKIKTLPTHIACMPVAITVNCHSDRYSEAIINGENIQYNHIIPDFKELQEEKKDKKEINTNEIEKLKQVKAGEEIFLTGELYVARDMAHKKIMELINKGEKLPFDMHNKIIFYAGPCPKKEGFVIGSIGPTTSSRMDKYAIEFYERGIFASIGKGTRSSEVNKYIQNHEKKYFTIQGGIAAYLAQKIKKCDIIAFEELGAEAIYKIEVEKLPIKCE